MSEPDTASPVTHDPAPSWREMAKADKHKRRLLGVQGRLMLGFCAVLFAAMGTATLCVTVGVRDRFLESLKGRAEAVALAVASDVQEPVALGNASALAESAKRIVAQARIAEVVFRDPDGVPIHANRLGRTAVDDLPPFDAKAALGAATTRVDPIVGPTTEVTVPVLARDLETGRFTDELLGHVTIGVSHRTVDERTAEVVQLMAAVMCGVLLLGMPIAWLLVRSVFGPVRQMIVAAKRIMTGDLSVHLLATTRDAFGDLARTFNELVVWVKQTRADLADVNARLAAANAELASKIEARTMQLEAANQRLAGEIAEKEDFLRAVSHDLNAPLRNIGGMVTMLAMKHKDLPDDVKHRLERIKKNVDIETDLINELLELSRIKTKRGSVELLETEKLVWDLRGLFENDLKTRRIDLVIDSSLPNLFVEKSRLRQVFQNLIDNAIKYMGERPVREIHVGCRVSSAEAEFWVRDTGTGIHPEDVDKVFFIFRRGRTEQTQKTAGKGIGLASVKSIIETYSGKIWVTSKLNEGTTFHFTINGRFVPSVCGQTLEQLREASGEEAPEPLAKGFDGSGGGGNGSRPENSIAGAARAA